MSASVISRRPGLFRIAGFAVLLTAVSWMLGILSAWPWAATSPDTAVLRVSFRHVSAFAEAGRRLSEEELARMPPHMRPRDPSRPATGRRRDATLTVAVDGRPVLTRVYRPTGLRHDGPTYGLEEVVIAPGPRLVAVTLSDGQGATQGPWSLSTTIDVRQGQAPLIEYVAGRGWSAEIPDARNEGR